VSKPARTPGRTWAAVFLAATIGLGLGGFLLRSSPNPMSMGKRDLRMPTLAPHQISVPFRLVASAGSVISVEVMAGGCAGFDRVVADTSVPDELFIAAIDTDTSWRGSFCTGELKVVPATIRIDAFVEGRRLIHAPVWGRWHPTDWPGGATDTPVGFPGPSGIEACPPQHYWSSYEVPRCQQVRPGGSELVAPVASIEPDQVCFGFPGGPPPLGEDPSTIQTCYRTASRSLWADSKRWIGMYVRASVDGGGRIKAFRSYEGPPPI
jgi:hypothetical protein